MLASGIVKANLGVFLSLVMVTFDIGSERCRRIFWGFYMG